MSRHWARWAFFLALLVPGASAPAMPDPDVVLPEGSEWRYADAAAEGASWREASFDDSAWTAAPAPFGFGYEGLATRLERGSRRAPVAWCFRTRFGVASLDGVRSFSLKAGWEDGLAVCLNGAPALLRNLPEGAGPRAYATARRRWGARGDVMAWGLPVSMLREGENVLAAEMHLRERGVEAARFELELRLHRQVNVVAGPWVMDVGPAHAQVRWETDLPLEEARVSFAPEGGDGGREVLGACDAETGLVHSARLTGLESGTRYRYRVEGAPEASFVTPPPPGEGRVRIAAYGDSRSGVEHHGRVAARLAAEGPDFVVHTGDLVLDGRDPDTWVPELFAPAAPLLGSAAFLPALGNHERDAPAFYRYFREGLSPWRSLDLGPVHLVLLDSDRPLGPGSEQLEWLRADLEAAAEAPWRVAAFHHPPFTSGRYPPPDPFATVIAEHVVPVLEEGGVGLVFLGHDHFYEHSVKDGVDYVITAGGGAPLYDRLHENPYSRRWEKAYHGCVVDATAEALQVRVIEAALGEVLDEFEVEQRAAAPPRRAY